MKLRDYDYRQDPTIKLSAVNADTVRMPAISQACEGFLIERPCDAQGILPLTDKAGVTRWYCRLCYYIEKLREYER